MFHIGANDLNRDKLSEQEVSEQIKELIVTTKTVSPHSDVYISLIFARQSNDESRMKTEKLNYLLQGEPEALIACLTDRCLSFSHGFTGIESLCHCSPEHLPWYSRLFRRFNTFVQSQRNDSIRGKHQNSNELEEDERQHLEQ